MSRTVAKRFLKACPCAADTANSEEVACDIVDSWKSTTEKHEHENTVTKKYFLEFCVMHPLWFGDDVGQELSVSQRNLVRADGSSAKRATRVDLLLRTAAW